MACSIATDRAFGPGAKCHQFDFTLTFEQAILGAGVSSSFLLLCLIKAKSLRTATIKTLRSPVHAAKVVISLAIFGLALGCLILWTQQPLTRTSVPAAVLGLFAAVAVVVLELFEHSRIPRPSSLVCLYLLVSIVTDSVLLRTLVRRSYAPTISQLLCGSLGLKIVLVIIESWPKRSYLKPTKIQYGPEETSGVFSCSFLYWLTPLLLRGNRAILSLENLLPLDQDLHTRTAQERIQEAWELNREVKSYSLVYTVLSGLRWQFASTIIPRAAMIGFGYAQTFLIQATIQYLETPRAKRNVDHAHGLIAAAACIYLGLAISTANFNQKMYRILTTYRGGVSSLVYARMFAKKSGYNGKAAVTLMSTDVDRTTVSLTKTTEMWAQVVEVSIGIWLLWRQLGPISLAPIGITLLCFLVQTRVSKFMGPKQALWIGAIQRRVAVASTSLGSMKSIKLSGLVEVMSRLIQAERVRELKLARDFRWLTLAVNVISQVPLLFSGLMVFAAYSCQASVAHKSPLSTAQAFTSFAILALLTTPAATLLNSFPIIRSGLGLVRRIQDFLLKDSFEDGRAVDQRNEPFGQLDDRKDREIRGPTQGIVLSVSNLVTGPKGLSSAEPRTIDRTISFHSGRSSLTIIVGPVGCGKSTFLKTLLAEAKAVSGTISISTPFIGYCSQTPWLPNCRIREAIVGPSEFDDNWYQEVINVCALETDFACMPDNDMTLMGTRGIMLSGGQKHRIALARALYSRCSILILDDFLSSLDQKTCTLIMQRLFSEAGFIHRHQSTVVLATHETNFLHLADNLVMFGAGGTVDFCGPAHERPDLGNDILGNGKSENEVSQNPENSTVNDPTDSTNSSSKPNVKPIQLAGTNNKDMGAKRQTGDWRDWAYYGHAIGTWSLIFGLLLVMISIFTINFPKLWLQWTTGSTSISIGLFVGIYALSSLICLAGFIGMIYQFLIVIGPVSAVRLHQVLVTATFNAPMSFFETTDSSVMLNRFSQDMSMIDLQLPMAAWNVLMSAMMCLMNAVLICLGASYIAAAIPGALIALYLIQRFYLRTSRQMRLLDLESKSPLYQHFTETIEGLETIRAFGWQNFYNNGATTKIDVSQKPYYLLLSIQRWLNLVLDCVVGILAVILVAIALSIPQSSSGGALGVALTSVLMFNTSLKQMITNWTQAETSLGSISRTASFERDTPSENSTNEILDPSSDWPSKGDVKVAGMSVVYSDGTKALRDVSFHVSSGQKIGICGRTGSGKSTLLSAFLRLIDPSEGVILVDGLDISKIPRNLLRSKIICLPQDALVFQGTFRYNLDPENRATNKDAIVSALQRVGLWTLVEGRGGLDADLVPGSLSHGEQQLLSLCRAILRRQAAGGRCILVLDEATSNLDSKTEALIQEVIREEFRGNTVIAVAHRLDTVCDADVIVVLENGEVVQHGPPSVVLLEL